jgi:hypothetical protein
MRSFLHVHLHLLVSMARRAVDRPSTACATGAEENGLAMRIENMLRWVAIGCAIFLLFGIFADRTSWKYGGTTMTDAAGYNMAALFSGVVALVAIAGALRARPRVALPLLGAMVATVAFSFTAYASGIYWLARTRGEVYLYGPVEFMNDTANSVDPAIGPPFFATAATTGAAATLALAISWLRQPNGDAVPRFSLG